jgi:hypothetical protein
MRIMNLEDSLIEAGYNKLYQPLSYILAFYMFYNIVRVLKPGTNSLLVFKVRSDITLTR